MQIIKINSKSREEMLDITREVEANLPKDGEGVCVLFIQHTTCGLTVNENADPDVQTDMLGFLRRLIPQHEPISNTASKTLTPTSKHPLSARA
jgi:secondary thiamine-phosphate synthase enzyme